MRLYLLLPLFLCLTLHVWSRDANLEQAWVYFAQNDLEAAKASFEKALNGPDAADAHMGLSIIGASTGDDKGSFYHYHQYYLTAKDPELNIQALWNQSGAQKDKTELEFLMSVLNNAKSSRLRAMAARTIGWHYRALGDMKKAEEYFRKIGAISQWQILGEFENISESGFDQDVGALAHPDNDHVFTNKRGVPIKWFDLKMTRKDQWVDFQYHFYSNNSIMYAQTFCESPEEREVQFRVGVSGSLKIWVNDNLVFSQAKERDNGLDSYILQTKLAQGVNRILVQVGSSETDGSNFLVRITDLNGNLYDDLSYAKSPRAYRRDKQYDATLIPDPVEAHFQQLIADEPDWLPHYLSINQYYLSLDNVYQAQRYLKKAKELYPDCTYLTFQLWIATTRDGNETESSTYLEEVKAKDPESPLALTLRYGEAIKIEDYLEAENLLKKIEAVEGKSENVLGKEIQLAGKREQYEQLIRLAEQALDKYPDNQEFVEVNYLIEKNARKNSTAARKLLEKYLKRHYDEDITLLLINHYLSNNYVSQGLALFRDLLDNNPLATGYYSKLAAIYFSLGRYKESRELVEQCIEIAPYVGSYHKSLGEAYREMDRKTESMNAFKQAIFYNPYDYEAREQLRLLEKGEDVFKDFDAPDIDQICKEAPDATEYPEDNSILLLDEVQKVVYEGGGSETRNIFVVKIFNSSGVDSWKEYNVTVKDNQRGVIEKAEVIKANGSRLEAQNQRGYLVFPNLEPGDAIHVSYRVRDYFYGKLVGHFWDRHFFSLFIPVQTSRFSLLVPKGHTFQHQVAHSDLTPRIQSVDEQDMYVWERKDVPALEYEPYMSSLTDVGEVLHISSFPDWEYVADWYAGLAQAKAKSDFVVQETVEELFADKDGLSERETVQTIYNYVVSQIRYRSVPFLQSKLVPQKASRVISSKQGDCKDVSTLFVAMANLMDVDAHLVLINTRDNGRESMLLPSIDFNHCIVKVNLEDQDYFVELTADNFPFSAGTGSIKRAFALEIPPYNDRTVEGKLLDPDTRVRNEVVRTIDVTFEGSTMQVNKSNIKTGVIAASMRDTYKDQGRQQQLKSMQEAINDEYPNIKLESLEFVEGLQDNSNQVTYKYGFSVPNPFMRISNLSIVKLPWANNLNASSMDFLSTESRLYPIELWQYFRTERAQETMVIALPEGKTFAELPESVDLAHPNATYSLTFTPINEGKQLQIVRTFDLLDDIVEPDDYPAFKAFMNQVLKSDETQLAFQDE